MSGPTIRSSIMHQLLYSLIFSSFTLPTIVYAAVPQEVPKQTVTLNNSVKIDLNTADVSALTHVIKGIGAKRAQAIVTYRKEHQGFKSVEELAYVPGIGKHFVEKHLPDLQTAFTVSKQ